LTGDRDDTAEEEEEDTGEGRNRRSSTSLRAVTPVPNAFCEGLRVEGEGEDEGDEDVRWSDEVDAAAR